jgi:PadR family transcriptional regulator, regulatory protein PadR
MKDQSAVRQGMLASVWGVSENNRKARLYRLTRAGLRQLHAETRSWEETAEDLE